MRLVAKPNLEKMARQVTRDFGSLAANARIRAEVPVGLRLDLPNPCHCGISLKSETVHHSPIITGSDSSVQQEKSRQRGLRPFRVCGTIEGLAATVAGAWACGAAGSASAWHAEGQGFESPQVHHSLPSTHQGYITGTQRCAGLSPTTGGRPFLMAVTATYFIFA